MKQRGLAGIALFALLTGAAPLPVYDTIVRGGTIYDGSGGKPYRGDVAIKGAKIVAVGRVSGTAKHIIAARGRAVAPGFINMLSHIEDSIMADGRAMSDLTQGVTLEVIGEDSMGPLSPAMRDYAEKHQADIKYPVTWSTLDGWFKMLEGRRFAPNIASFVGAGEVRSDVVGLGDVQPTPAQLDQMRGLVRGAMNDGAMGVTTMLIYAPNTYARTPELIALASESGRCGGIYSAHIRSEGDRLLEAVDETIAIARAAHVPADIYHLKAAGAANWGKLDAVIARVEAARASGTRITANMYNYTAGATGLDAAMPTWVQAGGYDEWRKRLLDPATRARVIAEMRAPATDWEDLRRGTGSDDKVLFLAFKNPKLKPLTGKTLAEVARMRGTSPEDTMIDLVIEDGSRVGTAYFLMSEDNVRRQVGLPWMSFGSDEEGAAPEGVFLKAANHPRAFGNFTRLLGHYVRDEHAATLPDAIRRLTGFPASVLGIKDRGRIAPGMFGDVVVFDPATVADRATFAQSQVYSTGVDHVLVNGVEVIDHGRATGALPGRIVRGPGYGRCAAPR